MRAFLCSVLFLATTLGAQTRPQTFEKLTFQGTTYEQVIIKSVTPTNVTFLHRDGLASVSLERLSPKMQNALGYSKEKAQRHKIEQQQRFLAAQKQREARMARTQKHRERIEQAKLEALKKAKKRVDLRPQFREYGLGANNQGRRPSCTIFSIVSALEYELARKTKKPKDLSEEYLIWATMRYLYKDSGTASKAIKSLQNNGDLGFTAFDVMLALSQYGIADIEDFSNKIGTTMKKIPDPPKAVIQKAKKRRDIRAYWLKSPNNKERINEIVHMLNLEHPIVVGLAWPPNRTLAHQATLSKQQPRRGAGHAVVLVGYTNETGKPSDMRFIFRNSWGRRWGNGGYGFITYDYMMKHLRTALYLSPEI